ncbi:hypothetical protein ACOJBM_17160 [Rhizobium beringeri]
MIDGRGSAEREPEFTPEEQQLQGRFVWRVCSITDPNVAYIFRVMKATERRLNKLRPGGMQLDLGCRTTFYNRVAAIPDFAIYLGQNGEAKAKAKYNIVIGKDRGLPMDLVEADECRLDIVTLLKIIKVWEDLTDEEQEAYEKAQARFWASAVVDHATGFFLSFRIHIRNPSVHTARAAFELVAINKNQIARNAGCRSDWSVAVGLRKARLDCASWYASDAVVTTITDASGTKLHPPVKKPWLRGTMERVFGTPVRPHPPEFQRPDVFGRREKRRSRPKEGRVRRPGHARGSLYQGDRRHLPQQEKHRKAWRHVASSGVGRRLQAEAPRLHRRPHGIGATSTASTSLASSNPKASR